MRSSEEAQNLWNPDLELGRGSLQRYQPPGTLHYGQEVGEGHEARDSGAEQGLFPSLRVLAGAFAVTHINRAWGGGLGAVC